MTIDQTLSDAATWIALAIAIPAHALVFIYGLGSPWYKSLLGVTIFAKWLSIAILFDYIFARRIFGEFPGYGAVAVIVYCLVFLAFSAVVVEILIERRSDGTTYPHH